MHLIATVEGRPVEIQIRTRLQHQWANLYEKFAAEAAHRQDGENIEVVVLAAESRDDLMRTHSRYFLSLHELASQVG